MISILPSMLAADSGILREEAQRAEAAGADALHLDIMDGAYVDNMSFGPAIAAMLRKAVGIPIDAHLMTARPDKWIAPFADAGVDMISVHPESGCHLHRVLADIRRRGMKAGVALNPATAPSALDWVWSDIDYVLVMTVNPGFGGQRLIPACVEKVKVMRAQIAARGLDIGVEVDGGVDANTTPMLIDAGADMLVAGSALFGAADMRSAVEGFRGRR